MNHKILPRGWNRRVRSSVLHILALGQYRVRPGRPLPGQDFHLLEQRTFTAHLDQYTPLKPLSALWRGSRRR